MIADIERRGGTGPEASIVKVFYSELLQRLMAFGVSLSGLVTHRNGAKPVSAGYESGNWMLDYVDSWSWITGGGTNEIQRTVVGERVLVFSALSWFRNSILAWWRGQEGRRFR